MRVLVSWLREYAAVDAGIQPLADALTMRGFEVSAIDPPPAGIDAPGPDGVLDLEITTNRPDCLSVVGVAREVSAIYGLPLDRPAAEEPSGDNDGAPAVSVAIEDAELCPRYAAAVAEVTVGPSPRWLAARLEAAGVRPINNVVDVTNYVMLELGHPMHAFDLDRLADRSLRIRRANPGEQIRTLDGVEHTLKGDMLVIADAARPQAVAGVMGGAESEVTGRTRVVVFESAYFAPVSVRRTGRRLGVSTDASYRFERGADIEAPVVAMRRALALLAAIKAGTPRGGVIDEYPHPARPTVIELRHDRIGRVLGIDVGRDFVPSILTRLGFTVDPAGPTAGSEPWRVTVPSFRVDVHREIDLVEEIARHHGYDQLPSTFPAMTRPPAVPGGWLARQRLTRRVLTASGCSEAITYGFIEDAAAAPFTDQPDDVVRIANPLSEKFVVLRPSLLPGLLDALIRNRRREHRDVRLFEIGKRFRHSHGETASVAIALTGAGAAEHWSAADRQMDLFDIKGIVERLCEALRVHPSFVPTDDNQALVPGRAAAVQVTGADGVVTVGHLGQLLPAAATARGLPATDDPVFVAELDVDRLAAVADDAPSLRATPVPRYPSVVRDLAVVINRALRAGEVRGTIQAAAPDTLVHVQEFDRYEGKGIPPGCVSLAFHLTFRAADRTLTDAEVQEAIDAVVAALKQQHQAELR